MNWGPAGAVGSLAQRSRLPGVWLLTALCMALTYYLHFHARQDVFTHLFYVPIVLGGVWGGWQAVAVAAVLAGNLVLSHLLSLGAVPIGHDLVRGGMLLLVAGVLGWAAEQRRRHEERAREEHRLYVGQIQLHLDYVQRVSHELRNPLQASLGALDCLDPEGDPELQRNLMAVLGRNIDRMRVHIKELTADVRSN